MKYVARLAFDANGQETSAIVVDEFNDVQAAIRFIDTPYGEDGHLARELALVTMMHMAILMNERFLKND